MRGCGRGERPAFPAPSVSEGRRFTGKTRAKTRGEIAKLSLDVIARSEATKQSILSLRGQMDCFAPLAMTALQLNCRWLFEIGCLWSTPHYASSLRKQGPITTGVYWSRSHQPRRAKTRGRGVPDERNCAHAGVPARAEPVIGRAFARPVGLAGTTLRETPRIASRAIRVTVETPLAGAHHRTPTIRFGSSPP
jgi:hypothetical protein